jgi:D-glycerate 3-kinase
VNELAGCLKDKHGFNAICLSIDDFYLSHMKQVEFAANHPRNRLIQTRGEPGTHDLPCATEVFHALNVGKQIKLPQYDKSAFNGAGDRVEDEKLQYPHQNDSRLVDIVLFEGWCVGFRSLPEEDISQTYQEMMSEKGNRHYESAQHPLENLLFINEKLKDYQSLFK